MKKVLLTLVCVLMLGVVVFAANKMTLYSVKPSTGTASYIPTSIGVDKTNVRIKSFSVNQYGTTAQTVRLWQDVTASTTTATQVASWSIPATAGTYNVIAPVLLGDEGTYLNCPGFTVTTSTTTDPVEVTVLYW